MLEKGKEMLKKWVVISILISLAFPAFPLFAGESPHSLEANFKASYHDYKEIDLPEPFKSQEKGFLPGMNLRYNYRGTKIPVYGRLIFEYQQGETDYDGTTQGGSPIKDKTDNKFISGEGNIGFTFSAGPKGPPVSTTFYTGLGYRYWDRGLGGPSPYSEEYSWKYIPVGVLVTYRISERWTGEVEIAAWFILDADIKVNLSEVDSNLNNPKMDLGNRVGWKIELPFAYRFSDRWSLNFVPSYEYYAFGNSNPAAITYAGAPTPITVYEPASRSNIFSLSIGFKLHF